MRHRAMIGVFVLLLMLIPTYAQKANVSDCTINNAQTSCRGLGIQQVSQTNAANTVTVNAPNVMQILNIDAVCSASTAALQVSASTDNQNFLTLDTLVPATTQIKQYLPSTVGGSIPLTPLGFQYIQVTMGTCGPGNTSTLTVSFKGI